MIRFAMLACLAVTFVTPAVAQDAASTPTGLPSDYVPGTTVTTGTGGQPLLPEGNPLSGLFTPQPQYPTAQTQMNPLPVVPDQYAKNPIGGLFNVSAPSDANVPPSGSNNMLQNLFTGQNPFQTPQAQQNPNPEPQARFVVPGFGQPKLDDLQKAGTDYQVKEPNAAVNQDVYPGRVPDPKYVPSAVADPIANKKDQAKTAANAMVKEKAQAAGRDKNVKAAKDVRDFVVYNPLLDASVMIGAGQFAQSLKILSAEMKTHPNNAQIHYLSAVAHVGMRDFSAANFEYREVLRLAPSSQLSAFAVEGLKKIKQSAN